MHICIVTTAHPIDDVRVYQKFCRSFLEKGFSITWVGPEWRQVDQNFAGDPRINYKMVSPKPGKIGRYKIGLEVTEISSKINNVDWFYAPDPDSAKIAAKISKGQAAKTIFDIHENYHDTPISRWLGRFAWRWVRELARSHISSIAATCDAVIAVNQSILDSYAINHTRKLVMRNCAPLWFGEIFGTKHNPKATQPFKIMHGKAEVGRGTLQVLEAIKLLKKEAIPLKVIMVDASYPQNDEESDAISSLLDSESLMIEKQPRVRMEEMPAILSGCAAGLISYQRDLGVDSLPNRLFEYMAAGIAVIAPSYSIEIAKIIEDENCGILVDFEDPASIAAGIAFLSKNPTKCAEMGRAGREAFLTKHNWNVEFDRCLSLLNTR